MFDHFNLRSNLFQGLHRSEAADRALESSRKARHHRHRDARVHDEVGNDAHQVVKA